MQDPTYEQRKCRQLVVNLFVCVISTLQGSYGVVKLAYNEDSEQYYVS